MQIQEGTVPILLVAAHNMAHLRNGARKPRDIHTGTMVELIAKKTHACSIISASVQIDPNWHVDSPFRKKVKELIATHHIQVVIDIHGRRADSKYLIEYCPNSAFTQKHPNLTYPEIDGISAMKKFVNDEQLTISEDLDGQNIPSLQIEIRRDGRDVSKNTYIKIVNALSDMLVTLTR